MSRRTRVSKTLYCWGELHHRWVVAVGWKLQNSSSTELAYGDEFRKIELCDLKIYILNKFCKTLPTQSEGSFIFYQSGGGGAAWKKLAFIRKGGSVTALYKCKQPVRMLKNKCSWHSESWDFSGEACPKTPTLLCTKRQFYHTVQYKKIIKAYMYQTERFIRKEWQNSVSHLSFFLCPLSLSFFLCLTFRFLFYFFGGWGHHNRSYLSNPTSPPPFPLKMNGP